MARTGKPVSLASRKSPLLPAIVIQVAKRIGLGPLVVRLFISRVMAEKRKRRAFEGYTPTSKDVFAAVFAKSGTKWMMQIATQIAHRGKAEFEHIHDLVPWPDSPMRLATQLTDPGPSECSPTGLRVIKTHNEADFVPYHEDATYLTILRDPKEVLVSAYYFIGGGLDVISHVDMDTWVEIGLREPGGIASAWAVHADSFWRWKDRPNVLLLSYPEVKSEPRRCIERVARTMGVELSAPELDRVIARSSFEYMYRHESKFGPPKPRFAREEHQPRMVRRGKTGATGEVLSPDQQIAIDRACLGELERLDSALPYAELFELTTGAAKTG